MDDVTVARALHVLSVVLWIGGVGFVTTVLLRSVRRLKAPHERIGFFDAVERRFAWQARIWTVLVGLTGLVVCYPFRPSRGSSWTDAALLPHVCFKIIRGGKIDQGERALPQHGELQV
jgi:uncharacterized membrane protein